jgi:ATP-dependent Clp protease adapter protein ClpS
MSKAFFYCLAYTILILIHEMGHVFAAKTLGLKVNSIHISGIGGVTYLNLPSSFSGMVFVYSAGFVSQLLLLVATMVFVKINGPPSSVPGWCFANTFTLVNLIVFVLNVLPHKGSKDLPSDGYILWKLLLFKIKGGRNPLVKSEPPSPVFDANTSLLSLEGFTPDAFTVGLEVLNDDTTPMEFVVYLFEKYIGLEHDDAIAMMLKTHQRGGVLIPLPLERANKIASDMAEEVEAAGQNLVCRAVSTQQTNVADELVAVEGHRQIGVNPPDNSR